MKNIKVNRLTCIATMLCISTSLFLVVSCIKEPPKGSFAAQSARGKVHFMKYCSSCHGEDGRGLTIDTLNQQPADLTQISKSYRTSKFPILEIAHMIDGRQMPNAHGDRQMPVWGEVFSEQEHLDEDQIKGKLAEIISYLMILQEK